MTTSTKTFETILERFEYQNHAIERYQVHGETEVRIRVTEPDGTVFDNMVFGPTAGEALAEKLAHHRKGKPKEVRAPTDRELIEALTRRVEALEAMRSGVEIPAFLRDTDPPADIADLIDAADTPAETNGKLLAKWNEVNGLIQLAHDRGERPSMDLIRKRERLESGIRWNRGRSAEQI